MVEDDEEKDLAPMGDLSEVTISSYQNDYFQERCYQDDEESKAPILELYKKGKRKRDPKFIIGMCLTTLLALIVIGVVVTILVIAIGSR